MCENEFIVVNCFRSVECVKEKGKIVKGREGLKYENFSVAKLGRLANQAGFVS